MRLIDTHAHIEELAAIEGVLERAKATGLVAIVAVGSSLTSNMMILELTKEYSDFIYPAIGIHPLEVATNLQDAVRLIDDNVQRCVAIGEIGLDYHYDYSPRDVQRAVFRNQIDIAIRRNLPIVIHSREAEDTTVMIVDRATREGVDWRKSEFPPLLGVINRKMIYFHCPLCRPVSMNVLTSNRLVPSSLRSKDL
jgi:TatD DNase family protein